MLVTTKDFFGLVFCGSEVFWFTRRILHALLVQKLQLDRELER